MSLSSHFVISIYSMTLTQTEKGYPPPIEHVGIPASIREEKGKLYIVLSYYNLKKEKYFKNVLDLSYLKFYMNACFYTLF